MSIHDSALYAISIHRQFSIANQPTSIFLGYGRKAARTMGEIVKLHTDRNLSSRPSSDAGAERQ